LKKLNFKELAVTHVNSEACCGNLMTHIKSYQSIFCLGKNIIVLFASKSSVVNFFFATVLVDKSKMQEAALKFKYFITK